MKAWYQVSQGLGQGQGSGDLKWLCGQAQWLSHVSKGPRRFVKAQISGPLEVGPRGAISAEKDRETEGLNSCLGSAANLERALKSILYPSGSPFSLF